MSRSSTTSGVEHMPHVGNSALNSRGSCRFQIDFAVRDVHTAQISERTEQICPAFVNDRRGSWGLAVIQLPARGKFHAPEQFAIVRVQAAIHVILVTEVALGENQPLTADA